MRLPNHCRKKLISWTSASTDLDIFMWAVGYSPGYPCSLGQVSIDIPQATHAHSVRSALILHRLPMLTRSGQHWYSPGYPCSLGQVSIDTPQATHAHSARSALILPRLPMLTRSGQHHCTFGISIWSQNFVCENSLVSLTIAKMPASIGSTVWQHVNYAKCRYSVRFNSYKQSPLFLPWCRAMANQLIPTHFARPKGIFLGKPHHKSSHLLVLARGPPPPPRGWPMIGA